MSVTFRDRYRMTLLNSPGLTGAFPLGPAYPAFQTFEATDDGLLFDVIVNDGPTAWEIRKDCTYTHSTLSLSRGTFVDSSTGSALELSPNAVVAVTLLSQRTLPVTITSPASGDAITYNGTDWVNGPLSASFTSKTKQYVKNASSSLTINKGQVVYISGANGTNVLVSLAKADADLTSATTFGFAETDIVGNGMGWIVTEGVLTGTGSAHLDTSAAASGDPIWLSPTTAGEVLYGMANKPYAPSHLVYLGVVSRVSTTVGEIFIKVQNGYELDELHNVAAQTPSDNNVLAFETSSSLWKNKTITEVIGNVLNVGTSTLSTGESAVQIGQGRTGSGFSYLDLVGDTTYSDFGTRLARNGGANSNTELTNRGTGSLVLNSYDAGNITLKTNNTDRVIVDSTGTTTVKYGQLYVGDNSISTASTSVQLGNGRTADGNAYIDLVGDTTYPDYGTRLIRNPGSNGATQILHRGTNVLDLRAADAASVVISTNNTQRVTVDSSGNTTVKYGQLYVGDTSISTADCQINVGQGRIGAGNSYIDLVGDTTYTDYGLRAIRYGNSASEISHRGTAGFYLNCNEAANMYFMTSGTTRMIVSSGGNIGIGVTSPSVKLDVAGTTYLRGAESAGAVLSITPDATSGSNGTVIAASFITGSWGPMMFNTGNIERLRIDAAGNVGIGTTTPSVKLEVAGTVKANNYIGSTVVNPTINFDFAGTRTLDSRITFTRASVATYLNERGFIDYANSGVARFDFNPTTQESRGLLIEEARSNLQTNTDNLSYLTYSNMYSFVNSAIAPDGRFTATKVVQTASTSQHMLQISGANVTGTTQVLSVFAKASELNAIVLTSWGLGDVLYTLTGNGSHTLSTPTANLLAASITAYPNGWYRCTLTINRTSGSAFHYLGFSSTGNTTGDGYSGLYIWGLQLEDGAMPTSYIPCTYTSTGSSTTATYFNNSGVLTTALANVARYENNPTNLMVPARIVLEPSVANWARATEDFSQSLWSKFGSTITTAAGIAPDGNNTANKLADDSTTGFHGIVYYPPKTTAVTDFYTLSLFVKPVEYYSITLQTDGTGLATSVNFNLLTKTVAFGQANHAVNWTIQDLPNGWFRISMTHPVTAIGTQVCFKAYLSPSGGGNYTGVTGNGMLIWGAQLEQFLGASSYIPNSSTTSYLVRGAATETSTAASRVVDAASISGYNFYSWYNPNEGTFLTKSTAPSAYTTFYRSVITLWNDNNKNANIGMYRGDDNRLAADNKFSPGTWDVDIRSTSPYTINSTNYQAVGYKYNNWGVSNNAATTVTDTSASVGAYTTMYIGKHATSFNPQLNAPIAKIVYYPKRLSDAELTALTTI